MLLAVGGWLLTPVFALAWGEHAHRVVCELALVESSAGVRAEVGRLMALDTRYATFPDACNFADDPRQRSAGHYVNLPRGSERVDAPVCPLAQDCLFTAMADDLALLSDRSRTARERLRALKLLGHWVGDMHQPLHVGFADDRGGNRVAARWDSEEGNLHFLWDVPLVRAAVPGDYRRAARELAAATSAAQRAAWRESGPRRWADESYRIATSPATGYCVRRGGACWYAADNRELERGEPRRRVEADHTYIASHLGTVRTRLQQAGVRLAALLDRALAPDH